MISRLLRPRTSAERSIEDKRRRLWSALADDRELSPTRVQEIVGARQTKTFFFFFFFSFFPDVARRFLAFLAADDGTASLADVDFAFECLRPHFAADRSAATQAHAVALLAALLHTHRALMTDGMHILRNSLHRSTLVSVTAHLHEAARFAKRVLQRDDATCLAAVNVLVELCASDASDVRGVALFRHDLILLYACRQIARVSRCVTPPCSSDYFMFWHLLWLLRLRLARLPTMSALRRFDN